MHFHHSLLFVGLLFLFLSSSCSDDKKAGSGGLSPTIDGDFIEQEPELEWVESAEEEVGEVLEEIEALEEEFLEGLEETETLEEEGEIGERDEVESPENCGFNYHFSIDESVGQRRTRYPYQNHDDSFGGVDVIAHAEPAPDGFSIYALQRNGQRTDEEIIFPGYADDMPPFARSIDWGESERRCFELPTGASYLTEAEAFDLYARIVSETLWFDIETENGQRNVIGIRGAYPATFAWHGNLPNRFNDSIVLLWKEAGRKRVLEFPVNTDLGAHDFGYHSSSALWPNRRYPYANGWHRDYSALRIQLWNYMVRDDTNNNGHWDSDRNGWLAPFYGEDHDREGSAHNIHVASVNAPLSDASIDTWSAGCQTIPGMENWFNFITNAWTEEGAPVDYYLIDARDIAPSVWQPCDEPEGTHACPYAIDTLPFVHEGDTSLSTQREIDVYNCSEADESGAEVVYVMNLRESASLHFSVSTSDDSRIDPDIHLLMGDDENACLNRAHVEISHWLPAGRYVVIIDTWVDEDGVELAGDYRLEIFEE